MGKVLEGIRVLDLTQWLQGPILTLFLADMGAEVIHVENPRGGDAARGIKRLGTMTMGSFNTLFYPCNRNKKSLAIDLHKDRGREVFYELVKKSDVFVANMLRPTLEKMKVDYNTIRQINPRIIYLTSDSYGRHGTMRNKAGFEWTGYAKSGMLPILGEPGQPPAQLGHGVGDCHGAQMGAWAIMLALYHREKTGEGQEIDTGLFGSLIALEAGWLQPYLATGNEDLTKQHSRKEAKNPLRNSYKAKDKWIWMCMDETDRFWSNFCRGVGIEEIEHDSRFDSHEKRRRNSAELISILDDILSTKTAAEWFKRWEGLGLIVTPVNNFFELADDPQAWVNDYFVEVDHPTFGRQRQRGVVVQLSKTPGEVVNLGPELGQHTEEVLVETLGYSWEEVIQLKDEEII